MNRFILIISIVSLLCAGCSSEDPRIDGSSNVAFESSMKRVTESLDESRQADFQKAIDFLARARMSESDIANSSGWNRMEFQQFMMTKIREELDGYTATEVIEKAIAAREQQK